MQSNPDTDMVLGPESGDNSTGIHPFVRAGAGREVLMNGKQNSSSYPKGDSEQQLPGAHYLSQGSGGILGANSGQETLPSRFGRGIESDAFPGAQASGPGRLSAYGNFGNDASNAVHGMGGEGDAGRSQGVVETHGCDSARGGHYFCGAHGCTYKTRSKHGMAQHKRAHERKRSDKEGFAGAASNGSSHHFFGR